MLCDPTRSGDEEADVPDEEYAASSDGKGAVQTRSPQNTVRAAGSAELQGLHECQCPRDDMYADGNDSADAEFEDTDSDEERRLRNERLRGERGDDAPSSGQKKKKSSQKRELAAPKKGHVQVNRKRAAEHAAAVAKRARTEAGKRFTCFVWPDHKSARHMREVKRRYKHARVCVCVCVCPCRPKQWSESAAGQ